MANAFYQFDRLLLQCLESFLINRYESLLLRVAKIQPFDALVSVQELEHAVNKFVHHRDLNVTHWFSVEGAGTVKINKFKGTDKKRETRKRTPSPNGRTKLGNLKRVNFSISLQVLT